MLVAEATSPSICDEFSSALGLGGRKLALDNRIDKLVYLDLAYGNALS
jgi:hypothetical protein